MSDEGCTWVVEVGFVTSDDVAWVRHVDYWKIVLDVGVDDWIGVDDWDGL